MVRSFSVGMKAPGVHHRHQKRCTAALPHNRIHRGGAHVLFSRAGMPMRLRPERTGGAQRERRRGDPGVMCPQQGGALLVWPGSVIAGMVLICPLASGHAQVLPS